MERGCYRAEPGERADPGGIKHRVLLSLQAAKGKLGHLTCLAVRGPAYVPVKMPLVVKVPAGALSLTWIASGALRCWDDLACCGVNISPALLCPGIMPTSNARHTIMLPGEVLNLVRETFYLVGKAADLQPQSIKVHFSPSLSVVMTL